VDALSTGYSAFCTWGEADAPQLIVGTDFRFIDRELNDVEIYRMPDRWNFPIPRSYFANPGIMFEYGLPASESWRFRTGGRFDWVVTDAQNSVPGVGDDSGPILITDRLKTDRLDRNFTLWSWFLTSEWECRENVTFLGAVGFAERPPTLTELYTAGSFINLLQSGLTTLTGDPELDKERLTQIDLGLRWDYPRFRGSLTGFHSWIHNYITFDGGLIEEDQIGKKNNRVTLVNTDLATIAGCELRAVYDVRPMLETFVIMTYLEGRDHTRRKPSRPRGVGDRSGVSWEVEPLPNIPAFDTRIGVRLHAVADESDDTERWSIALIARMVDEQERVAYSLFERRTPGYTVWNLRAHWWATERLLMTAGVDNLFDRFYREHLDYRAGRGVYQPGMTFYFGTELVY
jgi:outer membrane receptor protein involved in Fe transport